MMHKQVGNSLLTVVFDQHDFTYSSYVVLLPGFGGARDSLCFLNIENSDRLILVMDSPAFISTSLLYLGNKYIHFQ